MVAVRSEPAERGGILRTVLEEIVVTVDGNQIELPLPWRGGDHTELAVCKNRHGHTRWTIDTDTELLIRELARLMLDRSIAAHLNGGGRRTGGNNNVNVIRVRSFRHKRGIGVYHEGERRERDELMGKRWEQGKFVLNVISGSLHSIMGRQLSLASLRGLGTGFCRHRGA